MTGREKLRTRRAVIGSTSDRSFSRVHITRWKNDGTLKRGVKQEIVGKVESGLLLISAASRKCQI